jgi:hypothetical protein
VHGRLELRSTVGVGCELCPALGGDIERTERFPDSQPIGRFIGNAGDCEKQHKACNGSHARGMP